MQRRLSRNIEILRVSWINDAVMRCSFLLSSYVFTMLTVFNMLMHWNTVAKLAGVEGCAHVL
jgi:hypothetical protein